MNATTKKEHDDIERVVPLVAPALKRAALRYPQAVAAYVAVCALGPDRSRIRITKTDAGLTAAYLVGEKTWVTVAIWPRRKS